MTSTQTLETRLLARVNERFIHRKSFRSEEQIEEAAGEYLRRLFEKQDKRGFLEKLSGKQVLYSAKELATILVNDKIANDVDDGLKVLQPHLANHLNFYCWDIFFIQHWDAEGNTKYQVEFHYGNLGRY